MQPTAVAYSLDGTLKLWNRQGQVLYTLQVERRVRQG